MSGNEIRIGGFDLLYDGRPICMPCPGADEIGPITDPQRLNIFVGEFIDSFYLLVIQCRFYVT